MSRRAFAIGVVALWLAAIAWLVRREFGQPRAAMLAEAALSLPPGALYYAISLGDRQVGYASTTVDTLADTLKVSELVVLEVPVGSELQRTEARTDVRLSRRLQLRDFAATVRGTDARFNASGSVEGDSVLTLRVVGAGAAVTRRLALARPLVLSPLLPLTIALGAQLAPGRALTTRVLDPVLLTLQEVALTVGPESTFVVPDSAVFDSAVGRFVPVAWDTVPAGELRTGGPGPEHRAWVDVNGLLVLGVWAGGLRIERSAYEVAYENFRRLGAQAMGPVADGDGTVVRRTAMASRVSPPARPLAHLSLRLGGQPFEGLALDGGRQRLSGDTVTIVREDPEALGAGYRLPTGQRELAPFVRPEPLVQSDDPRLQAQARQVIGRARRAGEAAERLVAWVSQNVEPAAPASAPSALDVFELRRGDANEHTVLFVALARAVGLPARSAAGLVYLDGAFYYHAWAEVYLNGWVAVDPTFGQFPADATHLRLTLDGLARQLELARVIGGLTIEVLSADPDR